MRYFVVTHPFVTFTPNQHSSEYRRFALSATEPPQKSRFAGSEPADYRYQAKVEAFNGHRSGPFTKLEDAERACTAALATGCFYQVEITEET